jgi:hypothetical protein
MRKPPGEALALFREQVVIVEKYGFDLAEFPGLNRRTEHIMEIAGAWLKRLRRRCRALASSERELVGAVEHEHVCDRDQASISLGQTGTSPDILQKHIVGAVAEGRGDVSVRIASSGRLIREYCDLVIY